ncbi:hypothetical protein HAX54_023713 [Datura stramonium]|uniref:Uncharacterized protein n=1 Tax=Datura stramonium TaxID=4076 RepID=A0ABS8UWZ3_DATST|nr:hypothetical protein [Datura stramonium]
MGKKNRCSRFGAEVDLGADDLSASSRPLSLFTARRPLDDPSLWPHGSGGSNDDDRSGYGPFWASSKLDCEDDGPSEVDGGADGPSLRHPGYESRNDSHYSGDGPLWASSNIDGEDDGLSGRQQTVACVIGEEPRIPVGDDWIDEPSS